ncbi:hypothetical protein HDV64DRAFT_250553 [Trichoderma sp. TUCIM 5745]
MMLHLLLIWCTCMPTTCWIAAWRDGRGNNGGRAAAGIRWLKLPVQRCKNGCRLLSLFSFYHSKSNSKLDAAKQHPSLVNRPPTYR